MRRTSRERADISMVPVRALTEIPRKTESRMKETLPARKRMMTAASVSFFSPSYPRTRRKVLSLRWPLPVSAEGVMTGPPF